jgi:hypothetical protein
MHLMTDQQHHKEMSQDKTFTGFTHYVVIHRAVCLLDLTCQLHVGTYIYSTGVTRFDCCVQLSIGIDLNVSDRFELREKPEDRGSRIKHALEESSESVYTQVIFWCDAPVYLSENAERDATIVWRYVEGVTQREFEFLFINNAVA